MDFIKIFLVNISILITFAYLINLIYKSLFSRLSRSAKYGLSVIIFILAGWLTMFFSVQIESISRFDLRIVPLIFGLMVYTRPLPLFLIGTSIGLLRLTFGINSAAWVGVINLTFLGIVAALLCMWFNARPPLSYFKKATIAIFIINCLNTLNISLIGVIPTDEYVLRIAPITFPAGIALSFFFLLMIRDFQMNQSRMEELAGTNRLLRVRTEDLNQAKHELEQKAELLEYGSRFKSEFLANMSHELKTPLNSILLLSQMQSEEETSNEDRIRYARLIHQSGNELLELVNDILDLSKVEAGKLDIMEQRIALDDVLRLMEEQFHFIAESRGVSFETRLQGDQTQWISSDPLRINQILRNLLSNAFKFTDHGRVELIISTETAMDGHEVVVFRICDTGVGIQLDKQELIFEVFRQEDGSISRKYGGSGLGLSISRQLAELLGGKLELTSEKGVGSCFTLTLPTRISLE